MVLKIIHILGFWVLTGVMLLAGSTDGPVLAPEQDFYSVTPQSAVTAVVRVLNPSGMSREFESLTELPEGWKSVMEDFPFIIEAGSHDVRFVSFYIPARTPAGQYTIVYRVRERQNPSVENYCLLNVSILPMRKLGLTVLNQPLYTMAGGLYTVSLNIQNQSNTPGTARLNFKCNAQTEIDRDEIDIPLAAGQSSNYDLIVRIPGNVESNFRSQIEISARLLEDERTEVRAISHVDVLSKKQKPLDWYYRFPVQGIFSYVTQKKNSSSQAVQFDITGSGNLSVEKDRFLSFQFRGPDTYTKSISVYGQYDLYYAGFTTKKVMIGIGDDYFNLSRLLERYRFSRGIYGRTSFRNLRFEGFYNTTRSRWRNETRNELAASVTGELPNSQIGLNVMRKSMDDGNAHLVSFEGSITNILKSRIETEYALSRRNGRNQNSFQMRLSGHQSVLNYNVEYIYADPQFSGYYQDTRFLTSGLASRLLTWLELYGNIRIEKRAFDMDTMKYVSPETRYGLFGMRLKILKNTYLSVENIRNSNKDRSEVSRFDYSENSIRLRLQRTVKTLNLHGFVEKGSTENRLSAISADMIRYQIGTFLQNNRGTSASLQATYDRNDRYFIEETELWSVSASFRQSFNSDKTSLYLSYQNYYSPEEYYENRNLFELSVSHQFHPYHELALRTRRTLLRNSLDQEDTAFRLDYTVRFGIPLERRKDVGSVSGRITDFETQLPVPDAVVRINGHSVLTDEDGRYRFPGLEPKTYNLILDKQQIGLNRVTVQQSPMLIEVVGGEDCQTDLQISRSASISGRIMVYAIVNDTSDHFSKEKIDQHMDELFISGASNSADKNGGREVSVTNAKVRLEPDYGLASVLVEARLGDEVHRRVTDREGRFSFDDLRPGEWQVKCYDYNLPEYHKYEQDTYTFNLRPGMAEMAEVKVSPQRRRIQFLNMDSGGMLREIHARE